jgi:hypothetical protein
MTPGIRAVPTRATGRADPSEAIAIRVPGLRNGDDG